eukprot:6341110-Amphidinium_carterae.1
MEGAVVSNDLHAQAPSPRPHFRYPPGGFQNTDTHQRASLPNCNEEQNSAMQSFAHLLKVMEDTLLVRHLAPVWCACGVLAIQMPFGTWTLAESAEAKRVAKEVVEKEDMEQVMKGIANGP